jgi:cytochrome c
MDSFEINKLIGAFLGTVFVVFSISLVADALFAAHPPEQPGYVIEVPEGESAGGPAPEEKEVPIATLLQDADPEAGESQFRKCQACHTPEQGGANKVGPNLWGIVNRPIASHEGFSYSSAMREFAGDGKTWDYEHLNQYLTNPRGYVQGTAMAFAGIKDDEDRADLIAYMRTLAESPAPLPEPPAEEAETAEGGGDGENAGQAPADGQQENQAPADGGGEAPAEEGEAAPSE